MIWNTIPNDERLRLWKMLRNDIDSLPLIDQLNKVAEFCAYMPIGSRSIDYYTPKDWPTPWEVLFYGAFCPSSISLLIFYTLSLLKTPVDVELVLVDDAQDVYLLPIISGKYVLNYELGKVNDYSEICEFIKILQVFPREAIKIIT